MPDRDGYPTDDELEAVRKWDWKDLEGWFEYIKSIWWAANWGFTETKRRYYISTGGWSGNESIIKAMTENFAWDMVWLNTRRGGHYTFERRVWNKRAKQGATNAESD